MNIQKKIAASLAVVVGVGAAIAAQPASARPASRTATVLVNHKEAGVSHPRIEAALRALTVAENDLGQAEHDFSDFGGHRLKAQELTAQAIVEARKALANSKH